MTGDTATDLTKLSGRVRTWLIRLEQTTTYDTDIPGEQRSPNIPSIAVPSDSGTQILETAAAHKLHTAEHDGLTAAITDPDANTPGPHLLVTRSRWPASAVYRLHAQALDQLDRTLQLGDIRSEYGLTHVAIELRISTGRQTLEQCIQAVLDALNLPAEQLWRTGNRHLDILAAALTRVTRETAQALAYTAQPAADPILDTCGALLADHGPNQDMLLTTGRDRYARRAAYTSLQHAHLLNAARLLVNAEQAPAALKGPLAIPRTPSRPATHNSISN
jgi:hypothetical protein